MKEDSTKETILQMAFKLFSEDAYNDVTMEEVAKKAGISKGGLFYHFPSKYELAKGALFYGFEEWTKKVFPKVLTLPSADKKLKAFIGHSLNLVYENPKIPRFFLEVYEKSLEKGNDSKEWVEFYSEYLELFESLFKELEVPNPRLRSLLLGAILDGIALYLPMAPKVLKENPNLMEMGAIKEEIYEIFVSRSEE
ncbi:MAG: TetR/AcrR family transcriptional regulator [Euryarchaeota archaeon]|nr:TetR/AcrR family transcriptional regulator [Euryarchaeota archaeon]